MLLIDKMSSKPVYEQIVDGVERNILLGIYPTGEMLPSVRELSVRLGINPNTIQKSYAELTRRGMICPSPGNGCFVAIDAKERLRARAMESLSALQEMVRELSLRGITENEMIESVKQALHSQEEKL